MLEGKINLKIGYIMTRISNVSRKTSETEIDIKMNLDGNGNYNISTGVNFFNHMLESFSKHSMIDLDIQASGDIEVDDHHSVEDIGICLGEAFIKALGDKKGIKRYGDKTIPMDESLILCAVDISGRGYLGYALDIPAYKVGDFDTEPVQEFFMAFVREAKITLHIRQICGVNSHHIIEGIFKALGRTLRKCVSRDIELINEIPSTKGVL